MKHTKNMVGNTGMDMVHISKDITIDIIRRLISYLTPSSLTFSSS